MERIGDRIRKARKEMRLTQKLLADAVGVSQTNVAEWETHQHEPRRGLISKLSKALAVPHGWLEYGETMAVIRPRLVGYVGAGAEIVPFDDHEKGAGMDDLDPPASKVAKCVAVQIRGDSMYPQLEDGWRLYYAGDATRVAEDCVGRLCIVKVHDGPTLVKKVWNTAKRGIYRLESFNAPPRDDVRLDWAAPVLMIEPR